MKTFAAMILAAVFLSPSLLWSQQGGVKSTPAEQNQKKLPMHDKAIIDGTSVGEPSTSGGNPGDYMVYDLVSMYLEPGWVKGYVVLKDKSVIDDVLLRYDLYHQQMQFIQGTDTLAFSRPEEMDYLYIGNRKFLYTEYVTEGVVKSGYFEILHEGTCPLYLQRAVKYHLDAETQPDLIHDVYVRECNYYVKKQGEMARPVKLSKKSILCVFNDKADAISEFMKDNGLNGKTCEELKLIIAFYNSLH